MIRDSVSSPQAGNKGNQTMDTLSASLTTGTGWLTALAWKSAAPRFCATVAATHPISTNQAEERPRLATGTTNGPSLRTTTSSWSTSTTIARKSTVSGAVLRISSARWPAVGCCTHTRRVPPVPLLAPGRSP